jgi:hypothetical protein
LNSNCINLIKNNLLWNVQAAYFSRHDDSELKVQAIVRRALDKIGDLCEILENQVVSVRHREILINNPVIHRDQVVYLRGLSALEIPKFKKNKLDKIELTDIFRIKKYLTKSLS